MENQKLLQKILENTNKIFARLDHIEQDFGSRLDYIEKSFGSRLDNLEHIAKNHSERLQSIENVVTRIEKEHGDSIRVLFDYFVDQDKKHQEINFEINRLNENLELHNSRIFALEFYKEKLASK